MSPRRAAAIKAQQIQVISMLWSGKCDKEVADLLHMTVPQMENRLRGIYKAHKLHSRADLFRWAAEAGVIGITAPADRELRVIRELCRLLNEARRVIETAYPQASMTAVPRIPGDTETAP